MPSSKNALLRYATIDSCLQRKGRKWRFEDIRAAVTAAYIEFSDVNGSISIRTLREDLKNMRSGGATGYNAPIAVDDERCYYYSEEGYSIFNSLVTVDDLGVLQQALGALRQLHGLGLAQELLGLVERLEHRLSRPSDGEERIICQFEQVPTYSGSKWLAMLYGLTQHRHPIVLTYQPFQAAQPVEKVVHPQLLKQYNGRWFLVALREGSKGQVSVYALDRIVHIDEAAGVTFKAVEHEPATLFKNLIGVSVIQDTDLVAIKLRFAPSRLPYVLTKPLHASQQVVDTLNGPHIILRLVPTRELVTLILSFGADVEVIEPAFLRQRILEEFRQGMNMYAV